MHRFSCLRRWRRHLKYRCWCHIIRSILFCMTRTIFLGHRFTMHDGKRAESTVSSQPSSPPSRLGRRPLLSWGTLEPVSLLQGFNSLAGKMVWSEVIPIEYLGRVAGNSGEERRPWLTTEFSHPNQGYGLWSWASWGWLGPRLNH